MYYMWLKYTIITVLLYFLSVFQNGFLPHFNIMGAFLNLIFIVFFILIFFESKNQLHGFFIAILSGFFLDVFLSSDFGVSIILLLLIYFLTSTAKHFFRDGQSRYLVVYFAGLFSVSYVLYYFLLHFVLTFHQTESSFGLVTMVGLLYNLVFAVAGFYLYEKVVGKIYQDNQLKLF